MGTLMHCQQLTVHIAGQRVCDGLDLSIEAGQFWCILGCNGVGKTTLLHTLAGLRGAELGHVKLLGQDLDQCPAKTRAQRIGVLFQDQLDPFPITVLESVLVGRHPHISPWRGEGESDIRIARQALADMGMEDFQYRTTNRLSGGERQRAALATLLTQDPLIYLLDEPSNHLDLKHQLQVLNHFSGLVRDSQRALVTTLHDINLAVRFCSHVLLLYGNGELDLGRSEDLLTRDNLSRLYGYPISHLEQQGKRIFIPE